SSLWPGACAAGPQINLLERFTTTHRAHRCSRDFHFLLTARTSAFNTGRLNSPANPKTVARQLPEEKYGSQVCSQKVAADCASGRFASYSAADRATCAEPGRR